MIILGSMESADFLLVIIKLLSEIPLGVAAEALRANIDWKSTFLLELGQFGPNFRYKGVVHDQPLFVLEN